MRPASNRELQTEALRPLSPQVPRLAVLADQTQNVRIQRVERDGELLSRVDALGEALVSASQVHACVSPQSRVRPQ